MPTKSRSPTPTRRVSGWLLRAMLLLVLGVGAYYGLELADQALMAKLAGNPGAAPIEVLDLPPEIQAVAAPKNGPGNALLGRAVIALEQQPSLRVQVTQSGWIEDQTIQTGGDYHQHGSGSKRRFLFRQSGQLAGSPIDLLRVSDSRFLWSDLRWGEQARKVSRIDLRRVRRAVAEEKASAPSSGPDAWSRFGGLPLLLAGLDEAFTFGQPRRMQVRDQRVAAMVGRLKPEAMGFAEPASVEDRLPHHVVVALEESSLFPLLVEYRDARDPLSAAGLPDDTLLTPSSRPLLKIDLIGPRFGEAIDRRYFAYSPSDDAWTDETERELRLVRTNPDDEVVAQAGSRTPR